MKYAAAMTLYYPDLDVIKKIKNYEKNFDYVFIYDNSPNCIEDHEKIFSTHTIYLANGNNDGLPKAYNIMLDLAHIYDVDYMCELDQDSSFDEINIEIVKSYIQKLNLDERNSIGIIGPQIAYGIHAKRISKVEYKEWLIASGSFINIKIIYQYKILYDEYYFIDRFDIDFCKQLSNHAIKIVMLYDAILYQSLGENNGHQHSNHNPLRHYYIARNRLYYNRKYYGLMERCMRSIFQTFKHIFLVIAFENHKMIKISYILRGYRDYKIARR